MRIDVNSIKDFILTNYNQIELFSKYLGVGEGDILNCIHNNKRIINTHRGEESGSLTFTADNGKVRMWDYGSAAYRGDIFDLVGMLTNNNSSTRDGFIAICKHIINDSPISNIPRTIPNISTYKKRDTIITFAARQWGSDDVRFWLIGVHTNTNLLTKEGVYPVLNSVVQSSRNAYYNYTKDDPSYAYFFDVIEKKNLIKLYFPNRSKKLIRFITNNNYNFEGISRLYKAPNLVITKGYKERVILRAYLPDSYCVTNFSSESNLLSINEVNALKMIYRNIYINMDYDSTGIITSFYHYLKFRFIPVFICNKSVSIKDSQMRGLYNNLGETLVKNYTYEKLYKMIREFTNEFQGEYDEKDFYDLAVVSSPTKLKEYINYKFEVNEP